MAYQEISAGSAEEAVQRIAEFAVVTGWTEVAHSMTGSSRRVVLRKSGDYIELWNSSADTIRVTGYVEYVSGRLYDQQPGYAGGYAETNVGIGPYSNVFMFGGEAPSEHVHAVIETSGGVFKHLSFGGIVKMGQWEGGTYFDAARWTTDNRSVHKWDNRSSALFDSDASSGYKGFVRCDIPQDGRENSWAALQSNAGTFHVLTGLYGGSNTLSDGRGRLTRQFYDRNDPPFSGQVALGTIRFDVSRPAGHYSPLGWVPNLRYLNMARFAPGQEITVGSDIWKVFPFLRKGFGSSSSLDPLYGQPFSENHGLAFKKVS